MKFTPDPQIQFASPDRIKAFQEARLAETMQYLAEHSPFYRRMFKDNSIDPLSIKKIEDLRKLPLTSKDDLQKFSNEFICVERDEIIDYVTTSGTLGDPVTFALTDADLDRLAYNE